MLRLWQRMTEIFGHRWTSTYGETNTAAAGAGSTWAAALSGMEPEQIRRGIAAAALGADPWPPSLPAFRAACLGIPSFNTVAVDLRTARALPMSRLVWSHLDSYAYSRSEIGQANRMLREAYDAAADYLLAGGTLPEPSVAIEDSPPAPRTPATREVAERALGEMDRILGAVQVTDAATGSDALDDGEDETCEH